jgi:hypothetical protein
VDPRDSKYQRILWESEPGKPKIYELDTVTYGTAAAPFLATRTQNEIANNYKTEYPIASEVILRDIYVDDILSGANNLQNAVKMQDQLIEVLQKAGMKLHKWCSNNEKLLTNVPIESREKKLFVDDGDFAVVKALGLRWCPKTDVFSF